MKYIKKCKNGEDISVTPKCFISEISQKICGSYIGDYEEFSELLGYWALSIVRYSIN
jgi:hypothetical protein